jgi:hypothetical protein
MSYPHFHPILLCEMVLVDLQTIGVLVTAVSVTFAAIYYIFTLRINMKTQQIAARSQEQTLETRQAQLFMDIYRTEATKEFLSAQNIAMGLNLHDVKDFDEMTKNDELRDSFYALGMHLEGMGVLVRENLVDVRLVSELCSGTILTWWEKFGPGILRCREVWDFPRYGIEQEYLAKRVVEYGREHPELKIRVPDEFK